MQGNEESSEKEIKLKKGMVLHSPKYEWTKVITKVKVVDEEVLLQSIDPTDTRVYTFSVDNTIKNIKSGLFVIVNLTK